MKDNAEKVKKEYNLKQIEVMGKVAELWKESTDNPANKK